MAWTSYTGATPDTGVAASGTTTLRWGTMEVVTSLGGSAVNGTTVAIVTRATQRQLVDNLKYPNGSGVTSTRVLITDGVQWDLTVRDDTGITGTIRAGQAAVIVDMAGLIGAEGTTYTCKIVESGYDAAPKQPGERTITAEYLTLIEGA